MRLPCLIVLLGFGLVLVLPATPSTAHSGGTNAEGCHNNRKTGDYHCHGGKVSRPNGGGNGRPKPSGGVFANCTEARAAGAAPVREGDPGFGRHLDRDNDGVGCE